MTKQGKPGILASGTANRRLDRLSNTVNDIFHKVLQNENIMHRYQQFEFTLLDQSGFEDLLDLLLRNTKDYFQLDEVELWLYDPQQTLAEMLPDEYLQHPDLQLMSTTQPMDKLYGRQPAVRLVSTSKNQSLPVFANKNVQSAALLPLVRHGVIVGSLHFGVQGPQRFTDDKSTDFVMHLAAVIAVCLENAVNQERLNRLGLYDVLTKVKNRRAFHQALDKEVSRATRSGDPLSLLFVDLDYFKKINDTYGHPMGDKVLREVAQYINDMLRKTDHVCRYGGEEFALVLPNCGKQRAMDIGERIRLQISSLDIENEAAEESSPRHIQVTLSVGVCCWVPQPKRDQGQEVDIAKALLACADRGVYLSKGAGRNSVSYVPISEVPGPADDK